MTDAVNLENWAFGPPLAVWMVEDTEDDGKLFDLLDSTGVFPSYDDPSAMTEEVRVAADKLPPGSFVVVYGPPDPDPDANLKAEALLEPAHG